MGWGRPEVDRHVPLHPVIFRRAGIVLILAPNFSCTRCLLSNPQLWACKSALCNSWKTESKLLILTQPQQVPLGMSPALFVLLRLSRFSSI